MNLKKLAGLTLVLMMSNASASQQLAKANNCMACHSMNNKLVGPAFIDIKNKYTNNSANVIKLAQTIRKGGKGNWGAIPMPANPQLSDEEALTLAKWLLEN